MGRGGSTRRTISESSMIATATGAIDLAARKRQAKQESSQWAG